MMSNTLSVTVIVPAYNSEHSLYELVVRLSKVLGQLTNGKFEVILVNDGSQDRSWETIDQLSHDYKWVSGINLMRNYGQHNALLCGIREARYDVIVTLDDDLQNPPEEIPKLLQKLAEGYDVVYGTPQKEQHSVLRNVASRITKLVLQNTMGAETARNVSAFRVFYTQIRESFARYQGPWVSIDVLLTWGTNRFTAVPVHHEPRNIGTSNYTIWKLMSHALNMMTGFSSLPLQLASIIGFTCTIFGLCILAYVIVRYFFQGSVVPGFPFLASVIAIFSGAQLFALGIIGEYLSRMHFRMMERPSYSVRSRTTKGAV